MIKRFLVRLVGCLLLGISPAFATILAAGGEDIDLMCNVSAANCAPQLNTTTFRTAYARESMGVVGSTADPTTNKVSTIAFTGSATIWVHAQFCQTGGLGGSCSSAISSSAAQMIRLIDNVGNPTLIVRGTGTNNQVKVSSRTSGGVFTDLVTCSSAFTGTALSQLDLFISYGSSGTVTLYNNSVQSCTFSGDNRNGDGATTITQVELSAPSTIVGSWSEVIVADADTRAMSLVTMEPAGAGNATAWTGTNPCTAIVNATTYNDATFISSSTNNQLNQCTVKFGNANVGFPAGTFTVPVVVTSFRGLRGATGPQHIEHNLRTGGVDSNSADVAVTTGFANYQNYWTTNPNGGGAWATSDLTAAGFNIGVKSTP